MTFSQKNNVNLMYGCDVARIYYHQNEDLHCMLITMDEIAPFATKKVGSMAEHLMEKIGKSPTVDLSFNHAQGSLRKNKQKKLKTLLNDSQNVDTTKQLLIRWLLLLL